jgi:C-terminal processing protease CtpA/Prc
MSAEQAAFWKEFYDYENYGIYQVSRMEGNIGRIDLRLWPSEELAAGPLIAALELLKGVDALIVDVRRHLGGRAYPAQMVLSYLFEEPTHFVTTIDRQKGITREQWTFGIVPGARLTEIPVFVLTSWETASGGELLPFVLQNTGRGTIIGETTRGAGSRTHRSTIEGLRVEMYIPHAVDVDPETGEGWDGVGVTPDVEVPAAEAPATAHVMALEALLEQAADAPAYQTAERKWALVDKRAELEQATPSEAELREYTGTFGERRTWVGDGVLHYRRAGQDEQRLVPMIPDWFEFESAELYYVRLRFDRDEAGAVRRLVLRYDDGKEETFAPTNR